MGNDAESVEGRFDTCRTDETDFDRSQRSALRRRPIHETRRGSIPSFFIREISVVRLMPMSAAAP